MARISLSLNRDFCPARFKLIINRQAAKTPGIKALKTLVVLADTVIE